MWPARQQARRSCGSSGGLRICAQTEVKGEGPVEQGAGADEQDPGWNVAKRDMAIARVAPFLTVALLGGSCASTDRDEALCLTVWQYQLSSYSRGLDGNVVCIGVVGTWRAPGVAHPPPDAIATLKPPRFSGCDRRPSAEWSHDCHGSCSNPSTHYHGRSEATVLGTGLEGHYRYRLELTENRWRVRCGDMTVIY